MEAVDLVLLWWRDDDGDLVDGLVDSLTDLTDSRLHLADDAEGGPDGLRRRRRHRRGGGHRRAGADHQRLRLGGLGGHQARPAQGHAAVTSPAVGDRWRRPDFSTRNQHGEPVALADLRGAPSGDRLLSVGVLRDLHRASWPHSAMTMAAVSRARGAGASRSPATRCSPCARTPTRSGLAFDLLTDHWPHGADRPGVRGLRRAGRVRASRHRSSSTPTGVISWQRGQRDRRGPRLRRPAGPAG